MGSRYDRAITVFSPDGHLFQVEYALEAANKGATSVGVRGKDVVVMGVEKKTLAKLQDSRTHTKIVKVDKHISLVFAGLTADARVLINKARVDCQSYRLTYEDAPSVDYVSRYIAGVQQKYTQSGGVRPFGVSNIIVGYDGDSPKLYQTDPSGIFTEWRAICVGRNAKAVNEYLENAYNDEAIASEHGTIILTLNALLEVIESSKNIEIAVMRKDSGLEFLTSEKIEEYIKEIEAQKEKKED